MLEFAPRQPGFNAEPFELDVKLRPAYKTFVLVSSVRAVRRHGLNQISVEQRELRECGPHAERMRLIMSLDSLLSSVNQFFFRWSYEDLKHGRL